MECQYCYNTFKSKNSMLSHQKRTKYCLDVQKKLGITSNSALKKCEFCSVEMSTDYNIRRHQATCPDNPNRNEDKKEMDEAKMDKAVKDKVRKIKIHMDKTKMINANLDKAAKKGAIKDKARLDQINKYKAGMDTIELTQENADELALFKADIAKANIEMTKILKFKAELAKVKADMEKIEASKLELAKAKMHAKINEGVIDQYKYLFEQQHVFITDLADDVLRLKKVINSCIYEAEVNRKNIDELAKHSPNFQSQTKMVDVPPDWKKDKENATNDV